MVIKSKNTDAFKGLVSWFCLMLVLCGISLGVTLLVYVAVDPNMAESVSGILRYLEYYNEIPYSVLVPAICIGCLFIAALVFIFVFRQDRRQFEASIARLLSRVWAEIKLAIIFLVLLLSMSLDGGYYGPGIFKVIAVVGVLYFLCLDIGHNRTFFRHNIVHSILKALNSYKDMTSFEQRSIRRLVSSLAVVVGVAGLSASIVVFLLRNPANTIRDILVLGTALFAAVGVVGTVFWYTLALKRDLRDWNVLMAQIAEMYGGNLNAVNHVPPTSNLYDCAMQLNMIRTGIQKAVEEGTKADRTKVELITNVSHDIKTPLTSIISYVELLKKETDLPPHVVDYVQTISRKAERLSNIVQDVFEVSKAATGNISLNLEDLDIGRLLQQTFGEMDETLRNSQLTWRLDIPETPLLVHADGQRLYRVFQNLIRNCSQYSLEGSRAYVALSAQEGMAQVSIRNVSRNEITLHGDDLTARFVRGDQNRTTEGSGLGLSIAKSFTEACGGKFFVRTDGDLFIVTVQFPLVVKKAAPMPAPLPSGTTAGPLPISPAGGAPAPGISVPSSEVVPQSPAAPLPAADGAQFENPVPPQSVPSPTEPEDSAESGNSFNQ